MKTLDNQATITVIFKPEHTSRVLKKVFKGKDARDRAGRWAKDFAASEQAKNAQMLICKSECVMEF